MVMSKNGFIDEFIPQSTLLVHESASGDIIRDAVWPTRFVPTRRGSRTILKAALAYARVGLRVVPMHSKIGERCTCRHRCGRSGEHPIRGPVKERFYGLYTREEVVRRWWKQHPYANVGIETGWASRLVALHLDRANGAEATLRELERMHGPLPRVVEIVRDDGHAFLLFRHPAYRAVQDKTILGRGVSLSGDGGCFLMGPRCIVRDFSTGKPLRRTRIILPELLPHWFIPE
jgi:hypothetical protein